MAYILGGWTMFCRECHAALKGQVRSTVPKAGAGKQMRTLRAEEDGLERDEGSPTFANPHTS